MYYGNDKLREELKISNHSNYHERISKSIIEQLSERTNYFKLKECIFKTCLLQGHL